MQKASKISDNKVKRGGLAEFHLTLALVIACVCSASFGAVLAAKLGYGSEQHLQLLFPEFGQVEVIRLPTTARTLADFSSLSIELSKPDDFANVYLNNFLVVFQ